MAEAIFESVLPRHASDQLPQTPAGVLVSVADKCVALCRRCRRSCCSCCRSRSPARRPPLAPTLPSPPTHPPRLDSLVGLFAAGCAPSATADPYGLRRSAVGLLQVPLAHARTPFVHSRAPAAARESCVLCSPAFPGLMPPPAHPPTLQALIHSGAPLDLGVGVDAAAAVQPLEVTPASRAAALEFVER